MDNLDKRLAEIKDSYVKKLLEIQFERLGVSDINLEQWMIEAKKKHLVYSRSLKDIQKLIEENE